MEEEEEEEERYLVAPLERLTERMRCDLIAVNELRMAT